MRILHVITSLRTGGAEKLMVDLLPRLRNLGHDVELCLFDGIQTPFLNEIEKQGIKIHSFQIGGSVYNPLNIFKLIPLMKKFDVVHTHNTAPQLFVAIAHLFTSKCKIYTTEHSTNNRRRSIKLFALMDKWMYRQYNHIICISEIAEKSLRHYLQSDSIAVCTINNGVDVQKYSSAIPNLEIINDFDGLNTAIMVAGFRWEKDQKTVIRAYALLPENYHLLFAGTGTLENECKELALQLGLEKRVHFLGLRTDIPQLLKAANVVIMSSHFEGLSLSSVEGMACGNPFIASDVNGLREVVDGAGVLFPHENEKNLASMIQKCTEDEDYRKKIISLCQEKAKLYDISLMAKNYNSLYNCTENV